MSSYYSLIITIVVQLVGLGIIWGRTSTVIIHLTKTVDKMNDFTVDINTRLARVEGKIKNGSA